MSRSREPAGPVRSSEGRVFTSGGDALLYRRWRPADGGRAAVAVSHGFGEHGGRYADLADGLARSGFDIFALDHRGHGRSPGPRGHIDAWAGYLDDFAVFLSLVRSEGPEAPLFLFGHSMGALIVLDYAIRRPEGLCGVVASAAAFQPVGVAKPHLVAIAKLLTSIAPRVPVRLPLDPATLSRDPRVVEAYRADRLVHDRATVRWGTESLAAARWIMAHARDLRTPVLLVHGEADRLASPAGSHDFFEAVLHEDKELRIYPGVFHEPHNDLDRATVLDDLVRWLGAHCGSPPVRAGG